VSEQRLSLHGVEPPALAGSSCLGGFLRAAAYEAALADLINAKRSGKTIGPKPRPKGENVVDLMDALKKSLAREAAASKGKKPRKASAGQKEMLLPVEGKKPAAKKAAKPERATGRRMAG
jgi:DNA end-binding protein Ku